MKGLVRLLASMRLLGRLGDIAQLTPPVQLAPDIRECTPPVQFGRTDKGLGLSDAVQDASACVLYRHMVKPKADATVLLSGKNGEPLLVGGRYGKGRVAVFVEPERVYGNR